MRRMIVAITGASGVIYGIRVLEMLRDVEDIETHLILSPSAIRTGAAETDYSADWIRGLADHCHAFKDIGASLSSGQDKTTSMLIAPCSIKTLSGIANSYNDELIVRSADVCLKEQATLNGAIVMPPVPALAKLSGAATQPWSVPPRRFRMC